MRLFVAMFVQLLSRKLAEDGYAGLVVKVTSPSRTEIVILATRTQEIIGEKGQRISELTSLVQNRCVLLFCLEEMCLRRLLAG